MEEQQIIEIVRRARQDATSRTELTTKGEYLTVERGVSPAVAEVVTYLMPHLDETEKPPIENYWWR